MTNNQTVKEILLEDVQKVTSLYRDPYKRMKAKNRIVGILLALLRYFILGALIFVILFPIFQNLTLALRHPEDLNNPLVIWIPEHWTLFTIKIAYNVLDFSNTILRSLMVSAIVMVLQVLVTSIAGYAFARLEFPGIKLIFLLVLATIIIPPQTLELARFFFFRERGLIGSYTSLYLMAALGMGINSGIFIFIFQQFFRNIPRELDESAEVDGASVIRTFWSVILPNARSIMITVGLFAFVWQYNDVYYASLLHLSSEGRTLLSMRLLNAAENTYQILVYTGMWGLVGQRIQDNPFFIALVRNTAAFLMMLPILVLFIFLQRYFVEGIERSGIVG